MVLLWSEPVFTHNVEKRMNNMQYISYHVIKYMVICSLLFYLAKCNMGWIDWYPKKGKQIISVFAFTFCTHTERCYMPCSALEYYYLPLSAFACPYQPFSGCFRHTLCTVSSWILQFIMRAHCVTFERSTLCLTHSYMPVCIVFVSMRRSTTSAAIGARQTERGWRHQLAEQSFSVLYLLHLHKTRYRRWC